MSSAISSWYNYLQVCSGSEQLPLYYPWFKSIDRSGKYYLSGVRRIMQIWVSHCDDCYDVLISFWSSDVEASRQLAFHDWLWIDELPYKNKPSQSYTEHLKKIWAADRRGGIMRPAPLLMNKLEFPCSIQYTVQQYTPDGSQYIFQINSSTLGGWNTEPRHADSSVFIIPVGIPQLEWYEI